MSPPDPVKEALRQNTWLRKTLRRSQAEAVASSPMTATGDNFFNAFAVYLNASIVQMSWLTAFPQLLGALSQLLSVGLGAYFKRRRLIVTVAIAQALVVALMGLLAYLHPEWGMAALIVLAIFYHASANIIQPQWRAWMGSIVPRRRRGVFFASRTRLTMAVTLLVFIGGGAMLSLTEAKGIAWLGFLLLFGVSACGRLISAGLLRAMHDPEPKPNQAGLLAESTQQIVQSLGDKTFRDYSLFVAGMQGMVAISAPYFAVYMLSELQFSYLQYSINSIASIATQFVTLALWGRVSDHFGNRLVMVLTSCILPTLPLWWLVSPNFYYLLGVQVLSGFAWSGFTLSTANYLYDIRPHRTHFAAYAAVQSALGACLVFVGALFGGFLGSQAEAIRSHLPFSLGSGLFVVFICSAVLRSLVTLWFIPRAVEPRIRHRPKILQIVFRVARFNPISGMVLDWLTVTERKDVDNK
ncbi:Na+/melibiose symporter-like transporter [Alteromonadaceae bacterium 2753L.S.0a.02]|nr:Na+/melibiose symporter-like transporter [Alteromonadaceae bacterium 2753L.S.0a.02]